jgi:hypothetical protein
MVCRLHDAGVRSVADIPRMRAEGGIRFEVRSPAAQVCSLCVCVHNLVC